MSKTGRPKKLLIKGVTRMRQKWLLYVLVAGIGLVFLFVASLNTGPAVAKPEFGGNCASCHPNGVPKAAQPEPKAEQPKSSQPTAKPAAAQAAPKATPAPAVTTKQVEVSALGKTKKINAAVVAGRTLVAVRDLVELLGGTVSWDPKGVVTFQARNTTITMSTKAKEATVNGKPVTVDVGASLIKDQTMVPLRFVAEKLGLKVDASADGKKITVSYILGLNKETALPGYVGSATCKACHAEIYAAWQGTRHSKMLQDAKTPGAIVLGDFTTNTYFKWEDVKYIVGNGLEGGQRYVGEKDGKLMYLPANWDNEKRQWVKADPREYTCAPCHTTGYNKNTNTWAENGITCESCHGPGAEHVKAPSKSNIKSGTGVDMCSSCHGDDRQTGALKKMWNPPDEEFTGGHLGLFAHEIDAVNAPGYHYSDRCLGCHSATYIVAQAEGKKPPTYDDFMKGNLKSDRNGITCVVCHDPHKNTGFEYQLRKDPVATCTQCHDRPDHHPSATVQTKGGPIYQADGSAVYVGASKQATCEDCHMIEGSHTFTPGVLAITSHGTTITYNACGKCHTQFGPASDLNEKTNKVDPALTEKIKKGQEAMRAIQEKVEEEFAPLKARQEAVQKKFDELKQANPNSDKVKQAEPYVTAAFKNVEIFENDGSKGIHNMKYVEAMLQTLEDQLAKAEALLR